MKQGFSLVELSIVLVILGLLTGGILAGQSLIHAAELRAVSTEYQRYRTALFSFRDKYFALPGDMRNATQFWGTAGTCPGTSAAIGTGTQTCNGDGIGRIGNSTDSNEFFRFWQHLANAGLIEGSFTGVANSTTATDTNTNPGWNAPGSKLAQGRWAVNDWGTYTITHLGAFEGTYDHVFMFGAGNTTAGSIGWPASPLLSSEDAWNIDMKLDDGKPGTGIMTVRESEGPTTCHNQTPAATALAGVAAYLLTSTGAACSVQFKTGL